MNKCCKKTDFLVDLFTRKMYAHVYNGEKKNIWNAHFFKTPISCIVGFCVVLYEQLRVPTQLPTYRNMQTILTILHRSRQHLSREGIQLSR